MNNTAWKYLNKQDRNNLFFVIRGDKPQQETLAVKRNTMDNGATVLDILGGDNYLGLGRSSLSGQSMSEIFLNIKEKTLAWKPDIIRLWKFPKEMKEFTIDQQKNMIAFSGSHFRLPLLCGFQTNAWNRCRKANTQHRCVSSWQISLHATISSGLTVATRWHNSGLRTGTLHRLVCLARAAWRSANCSAC